MSSHPATLAQEDAISRPADWPRRRSEPGARSQIAHSPLYGFPSRQGEIANAGDDDLPANREWRVLRGRKRMLDLGELDDPRLPQATRAFSARRRRPRATLHPTLEGCRD